MKKLAVLRDDNSKPCPFGLSIPNACFSVGNAINEMKNVEKLSQDIKLKVIEENKQLILGEKKKCYYAGNMFGKCIDCTYGTENAGKPINSNIVGSPFYPKMMSGIGMEGLYTVPNASNGYYQDNSIDRGYYYGMYSIESIANDKPANNLEFERKVRSFNEDLGMNIKNAQSIGSEGLHFSPEELAKFLNEDTSDLRVDVEITPENEIEEDLMSDGGEVSGDIEVQFDSGEEVKKEFSFSLPAVPGSDDQEEIEVPEEKIEIEKDPWKWTPGSFLEWLNNKLSTVPKHSGRDSAGIERAISYLEHLDRECSKAARTDINNEIDVAQLENARDEIKDGIKRLEDRLEKILSVKYPRRKKKAELLKNAQKASMFNVNVPLFISHIARTCINSSVSAGHDLSDVFFKLASKYKLSDREKAEVFQLLSDMNYPVRWDRLYSVDEEIDPTSSENGDWNANYQA